MPAEGSPARATLSRGTSTQVRRAATRPVVGDDTSDGPTRRKRGRACRPRARCCRRFLSRPGRIQGRFANREHRSENAAGVFLDYRTGVLAVRALVDDEAAFCAVVEQSRDFDPAAFADFARAGDVREWLPPAPRSFGTCLYKPHGPPAYYSDTPSVNRTRKIDLNTIYFNQL